MYNRYLAAAAEDAPPVHNDAPPHAAGEPAAAVFSPPGRGLSGRLQNIRLDMDTIIVLVIVWFLLSDDNEGDGNDWEQRIQIGELLLLGI